MRFVTLFVVITGLSFFLMTAQAEERNLLSSDDPRAELIEDIYDTVDSYDDINIHISMGLKKHVDGEHVTYLYEEVPLEDLNEEMLEEILSKGDLFIQMENRKEMRQQQEIMNNLRSSRNR